MEITAALPVPVITGPPATASRALIPAGTQQPPPPPAPAPSAAVNEITGDVNVRAATPRDMVNLSLDLYAGGMISFDDYAVLAFQPELHPDYDKTVGALTGEPAQPDRRRDFVRVWDEQLQFELRHGPGNSQVVRQTTRIRDILEQLTQPTQVEV